MHFLRDRPYRQFTLTVVARLYPPKSKERATRIELIRIELESPARRRVHMAGLPAETASPVAHGFNPSLSFAALGMVQTHHSYPFIVSPAG